MQSALEIALRQAGENGADRIHAMGLRVGALSGVVPDAMAFAFEAVTQGTIAEGARLDLEYVEAECRCTACGHTFEPEDILFACPRCGEIGAEWLRGRELELSYVELS